MPPAPRRSPRAARGRPVAGRSGPRPAAPHPLARAGVRGPAAPQRPLTVPFAVAFAVLVALEELYLGWLVWAPDRELHWFVLLAVAAAVWALAGAVLVHRGRPRAWLVLAAASTVPLLFLLGLALLFGALGGAEEVWWALAMLVGPVGCLVLSAGRPIREWTAPRRGVPGPRRGVPAPFGRRRDTAAR
ncbi:hypothetical protein [Trujillonella endophytica]|uniref:Uncharacterized protein n=1 Tax=Trujillonella endophytica TaxID=673521 RepID=A0A1H8U282_9ACTN|nr:hypothetical protein [Trujillella endophytica]SEO96748.1 hypothetical protein SAMN05660991_02595 [Trujillella endophytica]